MEATLLAGIAAAAAAINSGLVVWNFLQSPSKKNEQAIASLQGQVSALNAKLTEHEATLKGLPTKEAFHDLQMLTAHMNGDVRVMAESMKAIKETSNLMRDWLLEKGVK